MPGIVESVVKNKISIESTAGFREGFDIVQGKKEKYVSAVIVAPIRTHCTSSGVIKWTPFDSGTWVIGPQRVTCRITIQRTRGNNITALGAGRTQAHTNSRASFPVGFVVAGFAKAYSQRGLTPITEDRGRRR